MQSEQYRNTRDELDAFTNRIDRRHPRSRIAASRQGIDTLTESSRTVLVALMHGLRRQVEDVESRAALLDPREVLRRGYAIVTTSNGDPVKRVVSAAGASHQQHLTVTFSDGSVRAHVVSESE